MLQWKQLPLDFVQFCLINGFEIKDTINQAIAIYRGMSLYFNPRTRRRNLNQNTTLQGFKNAFSAGRLNVKEIAQSPRQQAFLKKLNKKYIYKGDFEKITQKELNKIIKWFLNTFNKGE